MVSGAFGKGFRSESRIESCMPLAFITALATEGVHARTFHVVIYKLTLINIPVKKGVVAVASFLRSKVPALVYIPVSKLTDLKVAHLKCNASRRVEELGLLPLHLHLQIHFCYE